MVREWMLRNVIRVCPKSGRFVGFRFKHRWLWPIVGTAALAWFLIRVVPKPTRATYPCQQWVAPVAAGFLGWLLSLIGATWAFRKVGDHIRQNRLVVASVFMLLGLTAVGWNAWSVSRDAAASVPTDPPNSPIGIARGINPGRVVWSRDPEAAHWSQVNGNHWWDPDQTDQTRVNAMMSQGLCSLTGTSGDAAAWDALFRSYNQKRGNGNISYAQSANKKIVIKINQNPANESNNNNYAKNGCNNENAIVANPHLIYALLWQLVNHAGVAQSDITVYDASGWKRGWGGPRTIGDCIYQYNHAAFPSVHFMDGLGLQGRELAAWSSTENIRYTTGKGGDESKGKIIVNQVLDAGFLINMAIMKSHGDGPTLCAKNHYGSIDGQRHGPLYGNSSYYSNLVELMGHKDLGEKTLLFMIDALYGSSGPNNVPSKWNKVPFNGSWPSSVFLSQDGVAIDSVGFDFLNAEFGLPQNTDYHLHEAAYVPGADGKKLSGVAYAPNVGSTATIGSLGVHEHWNNATDRKYSRDLGTGNGIELVQMLPAQNVSCSITSPAQNATFNQGSNITVQASASTGSGNITKVEFYRNGALVGTDTDGSNGWSNSWTNAAWGSYVLTAKAFSSGGGSATSSAVSIWVLRPPENPASTLNGLDYQYYEGTWDVLPNFDSLTPAKFGTSANVDMGVRNRDEYYGLRFRGYVQAPTDGVYHFYVSSDDGSKQYIGSTEIVNNDGLHGMQEVSAAIGLKAGKHAVTVTFFQKAGGQGLSVSWDGPGIGKQVIPDARLWRAVANQAPLIDSFPFANPNPVQIPNSTTCSVVAIDDGLPNSPGVLTYTWSKVSGPGTVTFGANNGTTTAYDCTASFSAAGEYVLRVTVSDGQLTDTDTVAVSVTGGGSGSGTIRREVWTSVTGTGIAQIPLAADPSTVDELTSFEAPTNWADNYGTRVRGYIHPPVSGSYTFWIASDDNGELWLSSDQDPAHKARIATVGGWTNSREWTKFSSQQSVSVNLTAGQKYYIEALQKEGGGGDNLAVAWQGPGLAQAVIGGQYLSPYVPNGLPAPWESQDIGSVGLAGSATYGSGAFTVNGGGADIWNAADGFHYVYQSLTGDGEIIARVTSLQNTDAWAKTGVMMRETLTAGSKHAMMVVTPGNGLAFQYRATTDGSSSHVSGGGATTPRWVRLTRIGNTFTGYASVDGSAWTLVSSATIPMGASLFVGLPVTAHSNGALCTAVLDNVTVKTTVAFSVKVNFQLASAAVPSGYLMDGGAVFGDRGNGYSYGWNADNSTTGRDRNAANSPDQRYDTLEHLQKPENPDAVWEIAVPNGTYRVHAVSGDPGFTDSVFKLNVEGVLAINGTPTTAQLWHEGTVTVTVSDGRLTIGNAAGAANNKICFIEIDRQ